MLNNTNVPVLMVFFNRSEPLKKVFEAVRAAKPPKLFLAQDGAREGNENDLTNIALCRESVKNIDWDCEVYYDFSDVNLGCGRRMSSAISWAFEYVDRLMILEDDCVPSADFFPFCEELLERYKDDKRVSMISAMNHIQKYENCTKDSYIFCNSGAIWGWATWKRQWDMYDFELSYMQELDVLNRIKKSSYPRYYKIDLLNQGKDRWEKLKKGEKLSSWTFQFNILRVLNHQLTIVPCENMISNVGLTDDSTHAVGDIKLIPKGLQSVFYMKSGRMTFPLKHPKCMYCDDEFDRLVWKRLGLPRCRACYRKIESILRRLFLADSKEKRKIFSKIFRRA